MNTNPPLPTGVPAILIGGPLNGRRPSSPQPHNEDTPADTFEWGDIADWAGRAVYIRGALREDDHVWPYYYACAAKRSET